MCTVSFLPLSNSGFVLTSNRDEWAKRSPALAPRRHKINGKYVFFPQDTLAGGTWIATCEYNYTLCLLNGAFDTHTPTPPYRLSRGKMLLDFYQHDGLDDFASNYNFFGIAPFTLLVINSTAHLQLHELRWDGIQLHVQSKPVDIPQIWSSVTLYDRTTIALREHLFVDFLSKYTQPTQENMLHFHEFAGTNNSETDLVMHRDTGVLTQSITSILKDETNYKMSYRDLQKNQTYLYRILQSARTC